MHSLLTVITLIFVTCNIDLLSCQDAQLTPPEVPVCPGLQVEFQCIQAVSSPFRWRVNIQDVVLETIVDEDSTNSTLTNDPGFGFVANTYSNASFITSTLRVIAVSNLTGAVVQCIGVDGILESTIQIGNSERPNATQGVSDVFECCLVNITWTPVEDATYYQVCLSDTPERCLNSTTSFAEVDMIRPGIYTATVTTFNQCNSDGAASASFTIQVLPSNTKPVLSTGVIAGITIGAIGGVLLVGIVIAVSGIVGYKCKEK